MKSEREKEREKEGKGVRAKPKRKRKRTRNRQAYDARLNRYAIDLLITAPLTQRDSHQCYGFIRPLPSLATLQ